MIRDVFRYAIQVRSWRFKGQKGRRVVLAKGMDHLCYTRNVVVRGADESMRDRVESRESRLVLSVHSRDEVLPGILSQHADTTETCPDVAKDGILFTPFVVETDEVNVQLEVVFEPSQGFLLARICLCWDEVSVWKDRAVKEGLGRLSQTDNTISETEPVFVRRGVTTKRVARPPERLATL